MHIPIPHAPCPRGEVHSHIRLKCSIALFSIIQLFEDGDVIVLIPNALLDLVNEIPIQRITLSDIYETSLFKIKNEFIESFLTEEEVESLHKLSHYYKTVTT
jgi:hypothetical protein